MRAYDEAWADLAERCLEPNPFVEPGFSLTLAEHLPARGRPDFLVVSEPGTGETVRLLAVVPLLPGGVLTPARVWRHELMALGMPMLDGQRALPALHAMLRFLDARYPRCPALHLGFVTAGGPTMALLTVAAAEAGRGLRNLDPRRRALLVHDSATPRGLEALSKRRRKEAMRQRRRLNEAGALRYASLVGDEAGRAVEEFLTLEAHGWKKRRGALLGDPAVAGFARRMIADFAERGRIRLDGLRSAGAWIAMGVILRSGDREFFWKTAYAEEHAAFSPGLQFTLELTRHQTAFSRALATDSCALPDHPMIDRQWRERLDLVDVMVGLAAGGGRRFSAAVAVEAARGRLRAWLKRLVKTVVGLDARASLRGLPGGTKSVDES